MGIEEGAFEGRIITVTRPVTARGISDALGCEAYMIIGEFLKLDEFFASDSDLPDESVQRLAAHLGVTINISGDEGGVPVETSIGPKTPPTLVSHAEPTEPTE